MVGLTCRARADDQVATPRRFADTGRTLIVSRTQVKYGLERNYLGNWVDRPLFQDSSLREEHDGATPFSSFRRMVQTAESYGLAFFPETSGRMCVFDSIQRTRESRLVVLPEFLPSQNLDAKVALLEAALKNPRVAKIGHRILITGYGTDSVDLKDSAAMLAAFREQFGDAFIF